MKPFVLLCTGGIGCGKSFVSRVFGTLGIPVYDCDSRVKEIYDCDRTLVASIDGALGGGFVDCNGELDRHRLASRIFSDKEALEAVEGLVYPALKRDFERWKGEQDSPTVIIESAVLLEKPSLCSIPDAVLTVTAPEDIRLMRVMERDDVDSEEVNRRMANQIPEEQRLLKTDYTICNDGRTALLPQILEIINDIDKNGKNRS